MEFHHITKNLNESPLMRLILISSQSSDKQRDSCTSIRCYVIRETESIRRRLKILNGEEINVDLLLHRFLGQCSMLLS